MDRKEIMESIEREWLAFTEVAESFPEEQKHLPGAVGHWNVYDALIHVAGWDIEAARTVDSYVKHGSLPEWQDWPDEKVDELNENMVAEKRQLPSDQIWTYFRQAHKSLVDFLIGCEDTVFEQDTFTVNIINAETWHHYQGHNQDLVNFQISLE